MFVVRTATALGATVAVAAPLLVAVIVSSKDQSNDEEEKIDFSFSLSSLFKCRPGQ